MDHSINKEYFKEEFSILESEYQQFSKKEKKLDSEFEKFITVFVIMFIVTLAVAIIVMSLPINQHIIDQIKLICVIILVICIASILVSIILFEHFSDKLMSEFDKEISHHNYLKNLELLKSLNDIYIGDDMKLKRKYQLIDYNSLNSDEVIFNAEGYNEVSSSMVDHINRYLLPDELSLEEKYQLIQSYIGRVELNMHRAAVAIELNHSYNELGE